MPAVTVDNVLALPRIHEPEDSARDRRVQRITTAPQGYEGEGFPVRRAFAGVPLEEIDPFIHLDQMGEVEYAPGEPKGTPWHPHRGFETVTYMIDGIIEHHDSNGGGGVISNGDTQWMTAGSGLLHIEAPPEHLVVSGGLFHGFQLWVNLPAKDKALPPRYQDVRGGDVKLLASADGGALVRLIAGEVDGVTGPGSTHTPITLLHATIQPGGRLRLPWRDHFNALAYVLNGEGRVGPDGTPIRMGQLATFEGSRTVAATSGGTSALTIVANHEQETRSPNLDVLVLGGLPIGEKVAWYGPFVMNNETELRQAFADYRAGRLGQIPAEWVNSH